MIIFQEKDNFPSFVTGKIAPLPIDYKEKYKQIVQSEKTTAPQLAAGVVLLIHYKQAKDGKAEYVFQLIKRSEKVSQAGDISCPGGILHPTTDKIFKSILTSGIIPSIYKQINTVTSHKDRETVDLINLFLANAVREAWEEIGLNPFRIKFLGALPCYSLTLIARTIFPLVCLTPEPFEYKLSPEVEKIMEVPLAHFLDSSNYAFLEIKTPFDDYSAMHKNLFPCLVLNDERGAQEILWGATFNIITNFLRIISESALPYPSSSRIIKKTLTHTYISGNNK